ncbi:hypothetical protein M4D50_04225 [Rothia sp. p3-SID1597]|nr:hypothetical protein [uncultured Kocuria sp.]MCT1367209.1 hypothetical protein [Rothia sp. p3-SID1597]
MIHSRTAAFRYRTARPILNDGGSCFRALRYCNWSKLIPITDAHSTESMTPKTLSAPMNYAALFACMSVWFTVTGLSKKREAVGTPRAFAILRAVSAEHCVR